MNIWFFLFAAVQYLIQQVIVPMFGLTPSSSVSMLSVMDTGTFTVLELAWVALSTFNLVIPGVCLAIILFLWGFRITLRLFAYIVYVVRLIPVLGRWI